MVTGIASQVGGGTVMEPGKAKRAYPRKGFKAKEDFNRTNGYPDDSLKIRRLG
jgi:hypothetical protein